MSHMPWPSIESFAHVRKSVQVYGENVGPTSIAHRESLQYRAKIKLHGTNAGIQIKNGGKDVFAQSRTSIITPGEDNMGFAAYVEETKLFWSEFGKTFDDTIIVFGEWCGKGIQKGVAITQVDRKIFAIFAIQFGDNRMCIEPEMISLALSVPIISPPDDVYVLPWFDFASSEEKDNRGYVNINFMDTATMVTEIERIESLVLQIDDIDPWVRETFKVDGPGEGLVWYPVSLKDDNNDINRENLSNYMFKTKGEKHQIVKTKRELIPIDPVVVKGIIGFVDTFVTEARLEQGAREINRGELSFEQRLIGPFIGWIGKDVNKESAAELEASGLSWKDVSKSVTTAARTWYLAKINEI